MREWAITEGSEVLAILPPVFRLPGMLPFYQNPRFPCSSTDARDNILSFLTFDLPNWVKQLVTLSQEQHSLLFIHNCLDR